MDRYINCMAHGSSEGNLLIGETHTALIDCGMAFCAAGTIQNVEKALGGRPLDYIFFSHTHYDHIGALPFFKAKWPGARVVTSEAGAAVLLKDTPRRVIRELSLAAAKANNAALDTSYDDDVFKADITVKEGDCIDLGGLTVRVIETPGHTRDSLSFYAPEIETLILNETPGVLMPDGIVYPCYLTSYTDTISAIEKCRGIPYKYLSLPHFGITDAETADGFFDKAMAANIGCRDYILSMNKKNLGETEMLNSYFQKYGSDMLLRYQPKEAFMANARATIACTLREVEQQN